MVTVKDYSQMLDMEKLPCAGFPILAVILTEVEKSASCESMARMEAHNPRPCVCGSPKARRCGSNAPLALIALLALSPPHRRICVQKAHPKRSYLRLIRAKTALNHAVLHYFSHV
jgi:hypothetical protein